jgi:DNA-binding NarL/FixJ family response regulator
MTAILVVDDHSLIRFSLCHVLRRRGYSAHACEFRNLHDIMAAAEERRSGLALLDLDLGVADDGHPIDELDVIARLARSGWMVLVISGTSDEDRLAAAVASGAIGWVDKTAPVSQLIATVTRAVDGRPVMSETARARLSSQHRRRCTRRKNHAMRLDRLTNREREVLDRLAHGYRAAAIAEEFVVSLTTVRSQIKSILAKLEVRSQLEAVALQRGEDLAEAGVAEHRAT